MQNKKIKVAIIGPGNIGTDLLYKILRRSKYMEVGIVAGIYKDSKGLKIASDFGIKTTSNGVQDVVKEDVKIAFDATSAAGHFGNAPILKEHGIIAVDLTPAAIGPYVCPVVNIDEHLDKININLITCGGQATIPIIRAVSMVTGVEYGEIVATIASKSAGQGTRQNIDEFTRTTSRGIELVGGAKKGKAIIILNPAEPPIIMRNTIYAIVNDVDKKSITDSIREMVKRVSEYVPGYRLRFDPLFDDNRITTMIEVEGAGDYLPKYAGNLDIETSAALATGERIAKRLLEE